MNDFIKIVQKESKSSTDIFEIESFIRKSIFNYYQTNNLADQLAKDSEYLKIEQDDQYYLQEGFYFIIDGDFQVPKKVLKASNFIVIQNHEKCYLFALTEINILYVRSNFYNYLNQLKSIKSDIIIEFLQKTLFPNLPKNSVARLSKYYSYIQLPFNHIIYRENEESKYVYLIKEGEVILSKNKKNLMSLIDNQIFGEYEVFFNKLRLNKAISKSQVTMLAIKGEMFVTILKEYPMLKQRLICHSVIKFELISQNSQKSENDSKQQQQNILLKRQKKALRSLSPKKDCIQLFEMSLQIQKERVRTGYKAVPQYYNIRIPLSEKCPTSVQSPQSQTRRKLETTNSEVQFRSQSPQSTTRIVKIISSKHNMFRQQPTKDILLHNFVNSFKSSV